MAEPLKYQFYQPEVFKDLGWRIKKLYPEFDAESFQKRFYAEDYREMELKAKMIYGAEIAHEYLPKDYETALNLLEEASKEVSGFVATTFPEFVALYGLDSPDRSLGALKVFTLLCSSEFGIRPFIDKYPELSLGKMLEWSNDENEHVRRLASEGCRPRLPWGMALKALQKDPSPILPILENLKEDSSEYVRRSVANNLNDISKDHPDLVLEICEKWQGISKDTDRLIKHACRTLLKKGVTRAMVLFGFASPDNVSVANFSADKDLVNLGESVQFNFTLKLEGEQDQKIRLEYKVHYVKSNGKTSPKVFQIKEAEFTPGEHAIKFKQLFKDLTTRKHYAGLHKVDIVVNGVVKAETEFELV